jgi:uncharacterized membrane protein YhiD involved in acid resistance
MNNENLLNFLINGISTFTIETILINMSMSIILSIFIYFIYIKSFNGVAYSQNFNITIVMVSLITSIIMMLIGSNLAISLGMVGALSIVRFRAAIKEPKDIAFLFWAIAVGLAAGIGAFMIAIIGSVAITLILLLFGNRLYKDYSYLLVVKGDNIKCEDINDILKQYKLPFKLRMRNTTKLYSELTYEITMKHVNADNLTEHFYTKENVREVHIVSYNGEVSI